ncbi:MAG: hypothetical protein A7316_01640 [Candidatus Altiarchaeales archaeon WOR_SM1_86-2]|nr:MAG: hypothetical protein A7315_04745 [Candidatus Altiarchaeales archaeon WOR_SM1_79]ODS37692.1 MAG: hypothetical protein A7316_01640 [Candidatus Altiarchaeales archaeon WOR_SM1_86-2]
MAIKSRIVDKLENREVMDWDKEQEIISYFGASDKSFGKGNMYRIDLKKLLIVIDGKKKDEKRIKRLSDTLMVYKKRLDELADPERKMMRLKRRYEEQKKLYEEERKKYENLSKHAMETEAKYHTLQKIPRVKSIEYERETVDYLKTNTRATTSEIANLLSIKTPNASRMLRKLVKEGKITRIQRGVFSI